MSNEEIGNPFPILRFDSDPNAILQPNHAGLELDFPEYLVLCFFREVVSKVAEENQAEVLYTVVSEGGLFPYYAIEFKGKRIAFVQPGVGAPNAGAMVEKAIAFGVKHIVACGGCGVLDKEISVGHVLLPTSAYRDEGLSYHYLPASETIEIEPSTIEVLENVLKGNRIDYLLTKVWTTDAVYRETLKKTAYYKAKGCLAVEMELSGLAAVAKFRGVNFGQYLYAGDMVVPEGWDQRDWVNRKDIRETLFWLSAEACLKLGEES